MALDITHHLLHLLLADKCRLNAHPASAYRLRGKACHFPQAESPRPSRQGWCENLFESDLERHARRHVRLDKTSDDIYRGTLCGEYQVNAGRTRHLREPNDGGLEFPRVAVHDVGEFIYDDDNERERLRAYPPLFRLRWLKGGCVIRVNIAYVLRLEDVVAAFHLLGRPLEREYSLLRVGDDRGEEMRDAVICGGFNALPDQS